MNYLEKIICNSCKTIYWIPDNFLKKDLKCRKCGNSLVENIDNINRTKIDIMDSFIVNQALKYRFTDKKKINKKLGMPDIKLPVMDFNLGQFLVKNQIISQFELEIILYSQKYDQLLNLEFDFGNLAVHNNFSTIIEIKNALKEQILYFKTYNQFKSIGDILVDKRLMLEEYKDAIFKFQNRLENREDSIYFGEVALHKKFVKPEMVKKALSFQYMEYNKSQKIKLIGDIMIELNMISLKERNSILSCQKQLKYISNKKNRTIWEKHYYYFIQNNNLFNYNDKTKNTNDDIKQIPFEIVISKDLMEAYIKPLNKNSENSFLSINKIKLLLSQKNIKYGIVDDKQISYYLNKKLFHNMPWRIAVGTYPVNSIDYEIIYHFVNPGLENNDPTKFNNVKNGELLAEKVHGRSGKNGINIFGEKIAYKSIKCHEFKCGKGAVLSENGRCVYASASGAAVISKHNVISVLPHLLISGDMDFNKCNVYTSGVVTSNDIIKNGIKIKAETLCVQGISDAIVETTGDLIVFGEIKNATIKSKGKIKAISIISSKINALDDIIVNSEIISSNLKTNNKIIVKGRIIDSNLYAVKGIKAKEVGSYNSRTCILTIGYDNSISEKINDCISRKKIIQNKIDEIQSPENDLNLKLNKKDEQIEYICKKKKYISDKILSLKSKISFLIAKNNNKSIDNILEKIENLNNKYNKVLKKEKNIIKIRDEIVSKLDYVKSSIKDTLSNLKKQINSFENNIKFYCNELKNQNGNYEIAVTDTIFKGTIIKSPNSSMTINNNRQNVYIKEIIELSQNNITPILLCDNQLSSLSNNYN